MRSTNARRILGLLMLGAAVLFGACGVDIPPAPEIPVDPGNPSQSFRVVSIGNSLTAGFMNGGLSVSGQVAGFPNLLAKQIWPEGLLGPRPTISSFDPLTVYVPMPLVGGRGFGAPNSQGIPQSSLYVNAQGALTTDNVLDPISLLLNSTWPVPYDNLGVPGATTLDVSNATDATNSQSVGNSFFDAILRNANLPPGDLTQLDQFESLSSRQAVVGVDAEGDPVYRSLPPMLATVWIGNNDILGGATSGNPQLGVNLTPSAAFEAMLDAIAARIAALEIPMVVIANIPSIPTVPYFTTVPLGADVPDVGFVPWNTEEADPVYVLLPAAALPGFAAGAYLPEAAGGTMQLGGQYTLTQAEVDLLDAQVTAFNGIIDDEAEERGWALVDAAAALAALPNDAGNPATFAELNSVFGWDTTGLAQNPNSAFSLDGIHPSEKGYAYAADVMIDAINLEYDKTFPGVDFDAVTNVAGFEQAPAGKGIASALHPMPRFTAEGARALNNMGRMLRADR